MPDNAAILARTARGAGWVVAWRMATRLLGVASTLILVRLLAPQDFGLVALATGFAVAIDGCLAFGLEDQIIRAAAPDRALYDTAFTINLLRGLALCGILFAVATPAAGFFAEDRLADVLRVLGLSAILGGLANVGCAEFRRDQRFDREFRLMIIPRLLGSAVCVSLAIALHTHWALVAGIVTGRAAGVAMSYAMHPYRPRLSLAAARGTIGISFWTWAITVAELLRDRSDNVVIGRLQGAADVGLYAASWEIATLPTNELVLPIARATMPGFAAALRQQGDVGDTYLRIIAVAALLTLPAGIGLSMVAGDIVALAFGQGWLAAVPVMQVLGAASCVCLFGTLSHAVLIAHAMLRSAAGIILAAAAARILLLVVLVGRFVLVGAAYALAISLALEHLAMTWCSLRHLRLPFAAIGRCIWRPALASLAMLLLLNLTGLGWNAPPAAAGPAALALAEAMALGAAAYLAALAGLWALAGRPAGAEADMLALLRGLLAGRRRPAAA
jgi:O-antigen/teichoic acid export membrane protein